MIAQSLAKYVRHAIALNQMMRYRVRDDGVYHANAVSDDRVLWNKYPGNPVIHTNHSNGQLIQDGKQYRLYTIHPDVRAYFPRGATSGK